MILRGDLSPNWIDFQWEQLFLDRWRRCLGITFSKNLIFLFKINFFMFLIILMQFQIKNTLNHYYTLKHPRNERNE